MAPKQTSSPEQLSAVEDRLDAGTGVDWVKSTMDATGSRKNDLEYLKELLDGAKEARQSINAEYLRDLDEQKK